MSGIASKLFKEFMTEHPDYVSEHHYEVYVQWLADKIEDLQGKLKYCESLLNIRAEHLDKANTEKDRLKRMVDWALKPDTQKALQMEFDRIDSLK